MRLVRVFRMPAEVAGWESKCLVVVRAVERPRVEVMWGSRPPEKGEWKRVEDGWMRWWWPDEVEIVEGALEVKKGVGMAELHEELVGAPVVKKGGVVEEVKVEGEEEGRLDGRYEVRKVLAPMDWAREFARKEYLGEYERAVMRLRMGWAELMGTPVCYGEVGKPEGWGVLWEKMKGREYVDVESFVGEVETLKRGAGFEVLEKVGRIVKEVLLTKS